MMFCTPAKAHGDLHPPFWHSKRPFLGTFEGGERIFSCKIVRWCLKLSLCKLRTKQGFWVLEMLSMFLWEVRVIASRQEPLPPIFFFCRHLIRSICCCHLNSCKNCDNVGIAVPHDVGNGFCFFLAVLVVVYTCTF